MRVYIPLFQQNGRILCKQKRLGEQNTWSILNSFNVFIKLTDLCLSEIARDSFEEVTICIGILNIKTFNFKIFFRTERTHYSSLDRMFPLDLESKSSSSKRSKMKMRPSPWKPGMGKSTRTRTGLSLSEHLQNACGLKVLVLKGGGGGTDHATHPTRDHETV